MGLVKRMWVPMVMVVVVAVGALTVSRLHGVFGSNMYTPDNGNADAIVQFNPKHVLLEIFGAPGTAADINYLDEQAQPHRLNFGRAEIEHQAHPPVTGIRCIARKGPSG